MTITEAEPATNTPAAAPARQPRVRLLSESAVLGPAVVIVAFLALVPVVYLLVNTFLPDGHFTLGSFRDAYTATGLPRMISNSLVFAAGSTAVALVCGTALAYLVARTNVPMRGLIFASALVPLIVPGVLYTISWIFLANPQNGFVNYLLRPVFGHPLFNVFSMKGLIFVEGTHNAPVVFLMMYAAFRNMDPALEESASVSGARLPKVLSAVTLPLVRPALVLATVLMMIRGLASFEVPTLLGPTAGIFVFTSRIYKALNDFPADYGTAGAYSVGLLAILAVFTGAQYLLTRRSRSYQTVTGKAFRPHTVDLGRFRIVAGVLVGFYFLITFALPVLILLYASFQPIYTQPEIHTLAHPTLANYRDAFSGGTTLRAIRNTVVLAVGSATLVMVLTSLIAWIVVRARVRGRSVLSFLTMMPIGIPSLIIGVSLLFMYLRVPLPIYGSLWILLIAYLTVFMPYGLTYATSAMYQISADLEEAGRVFGAGFVGLFRRVTLPLLMPGFVAGWIFVVLLSVRELGASLLLYTPGQQVLSVVVWSEWAEGDLVQLSALGCIIIALLAVLVLLARKLGAQVGIKSS